MKNLYVFSFLLLNIFYCFSSEDTSMQKQDCHFKVLIADEQTLLTSLTNSEFNNIINHNDKYLSEKIREYITDFADKEKTILEIIFFVELITYYYSEYCSQNRCEEKMITKNKNSMYSIILSTNEEALKKLKTILVKFESMFYIRPPRGPIGPYQHFTHLWFDIQISEYRKDLKNRLEKLLNMCNGSFEK